MEKKLIFSVLGGATLVYGGILTLADDLEAGVTMVVVGGLLAAIPLWRVFRHFWNPSGARIESPKTGKRKKKDHLKIVVRDEEERPTYH
jgi:hypothetical protein